MSAHGPRFTDGGYQAPRTDSAQLQRGRPLREQAWSIGTARVHLKLVPFEGGRPGLCELELQLNDPLAGRSVYVPCIIRGVEHARQAFALTAQHLDAGRIPDNVVVPDGCPLGP